MSYTDKHTTTQTLQQKLDRNNIENNKDNLSR